MQAQTLRNPPTSSARAASASRPSRPDLLIWVTSVMMLCFVWRTQDIIPGLSTVRITILSSLAAIVLYFSNGDRRRRFDLLTNNRTFVCLIALFGVMILGIPTSYWPGKSFNFLRVDHLKTILFLIVIAGSIRHKGDVTWFLKVWLLGCVIYTVDALLHFRVTRDGRWANLYYYDANDYGALLVTTIPLAVYFLRSAAPTIHRLAATALLGLFSVGLINSGSRGAFLGFIVAMAYILTQFKALSKRLRMGIVVAAVGGLTFFAQDQYWEMMQTLLNPQDDYNMTSNVGRKAVWTRGVGYMLANPILGVGVRAFAQAEGTSETSQQLQAMGSGFKWSAAHSSFVEIGAETGVTGLILFLAAFFTAIKALALIRESRHASGPASDEVVVGQALIGSFIAFMVAGSFVSHGNYGYLYALFGFAIGMAKIYPAAEHAGAGRAGVRLVRRGSGARRTPGSAGAGARTGRPSSGPSHTIVPAGSPAPVALPADTPARRGRDPLAPLMPRDSERSREDDEEWGESPLPRAGTAGASDDGEGWGPLI